MPKRGWTPSEEARAKMRAAKLANPTRYWLGKKRGPISEEHRAKTSAALKGRKQPASAVETRAAQLRGLPRPAWVVDKMKAALARPEVRAKFSGPNPNKHRGQAHYDRLAELNRGKPAKYPHKRYFHGDVAMRSTWEVRVAQAFDRIGIAWDYEPKRFDLGSQTYCPDFYLPSLGWFVEVKGFFGVKSQVTASLLFEQYPDIPLAIMMLPQIEQLETIAASFTAADNERANTTMAAQALI